VSPLRQIIEIEVATRTATFSLIEGHVAAAQRLLLNGGQVPACALAAFLYRDFGLVSERAPSASLLLDALLDDFGAALPIPRGSPIFVSSLFSNDSDRYTSADFAEISAESA
jgi:hypothetical protein